MSETSPPVGPLGAARRWAVGAVIVIGLALVVMPLAFGMFAKAPKGAVMIGQFKPFMTAGTLDGFQHDLKVINAGVRQSDTAIAGRLGQGRPPATFAADYPSFVAFDHQWPAIDTSMTHLMNQVQGNLGNYQAVAALPSFRLFPWFFVAPGVLLLGIGAFALWRPRRWRGQRLALVVLGVGLVAAPAIFQMFGRAPAGGRMMTAFTTVETTQNVQQVQGYFGAMAEGQGAIRLEIVPALEHAGLTPAQIRTDFPATAALDAQWVHILNVMTPMIGAMSDNVANYQAVKSLPPFPLFPWFFVAPGLLVAGLAVAAGRRQPDQATEPVMSTPLVASTATAPVHSHLGVS